MKLFHIYYKTIKRPKTCSSVGEKSSLILELITLSSIEIVYTYYIFVLMMDWITWNFSPGSFFFLVKFLMMKNAFLKKPNKIA